MYAVVQMTRSIEGKAEFRRLVKKFKNLQPALNLAYKRDQMITSQTLGFFHLIYNLETNEICRAQAA